MARPRKAALEYFPLDCKMNDKVEILEAVAGLEGFAIYIKLLQEIYQTENGEFDMGVVFRWKTLGKKYGILEENLRNTVGIMVDIGLFDRIRFEENQVLTSNGVKKRLAKVEELREKERLRKGKRAANRQKPASTPLESSPEVFREFSAGKTQENDTKEKESKREIESKGKVKEVKKEDASEVEPAIAVSPPLVVEEEKGLLETVVATSNDLNTSSDSEQSFLEAKKAKVSRNSASRGAAHEGGAGCSDLTEREQEAWEGVEMWLKAECPRVLGMKNPLIPARKFLDLAEKYGLEECFSVLEAMENYRDLHKKYVSAYSTLANWLRMRREKEKSREMGGGSAPKTMSAALAQTERVFSAIETMQSNGYDFTQGYKYEYE